MRIVVFSDSHGNFNAVHHMMLEQLQAECYVFLGDGIAQVEDLRDLYPDKAFLAVRGNCDWGVDEADTRKLDIGGHKIFYTHGHLYGVKNGTERVNEAAQAAGCDILLYGHTHQAEAFYQNGFYRVNPGSIGRVPGSYATLDILPGGTVVAHIVPLQRPQRG